MRDAKPPLPFTGELARHATSRRDFLRIAGLGGAALLLPAAVTACSEPAVAPRITSDVDLSTDEGVMRFAYVLAQIKQRYFDWVALYSPYPGITQLETATLRAIGSHAGSHRTFFYKVVDPDFPSQIHFRFDGVDYSSRSSVFTFGIELCELIAATFPWLVAHARSPEFATVLAKMSAVHGRHAAALRDLQDVKDGKSAASGRVSFAASDAVSATTGLNNIMTPREALNRLERYIITNPVSLRGA